MGLHITICAQSYSQIYTPGRKPLPDTPLQSVTPQQPSEAELSLWQQLLQRLPPGEPPPQLDGLCAQQRMSVIMDCLSKTMPVSAADG